MSGYTATIQAFSDLIEQESGLFSEHWSELKAFTEKPSDSDEELADKIEAWLQQLSPDSKIVERYTDRLAAKSLLSATDLSRDRGLEKSKYSPKSGKAKQNNQVLLINAIEKNSPLSASPPPNSQV